MSAEPDRRRILDSERAINEQYLRRMRNLVDRADGVQTNVVTTRSQRWSGSVPTVGVSPKIVGPVIGRVALDGEDRLLGGGFYIGSWHQEWDSAQVVSWAAPVASLFYKGRISTDPAAGRVAGRRTFEVSGEDLRDFDDEVETAYRGGDPFRSNGDSATLAVPAAPVAPTRPGREPEKSSGAVRSTVEPDASSKGGRGPAEPAAVEPSNGRKHLLRAARAVRAAIAKPKTGELSSVLATLQPDQYELVTWPSDEPLIVQGQPGTGKTVVATHRAAYLTHAERKPRPLSRVALIGPTDQYADHVRSVQDEIGGGEVEVVSMPTLMRRLAGVRRVAATSGGDHLDTVWRLGTTLDRCARLLAREGHLEGKPDRDARALVKAFLAAESPFHELLEEDEELDEWRRSVKNRQVAESDGRYLPFLAAARLAVAPISEGDRFDHILVDEAQDLRMLEWRIVSAHLRTGGTMSLFGDINQRHSDWTAASWEQLVSDLELTESDDGIEVSELELGYRSTKQILRYANQLLPRGQRTVHAIQEGPDPVLSKVAKGEVMAEVARSAADLSVRHGSGLVAVISMSPTACSDALRRDGWSRSGTRQGWKKDGCTVVVLDPEMARGLEFDGVVVVEPGDFPMNLGRLGPLYTSLTRATRELVVVHSSGLPRDLRRTR